MSKNFNPLVAAVAAAGIVAAILYVWQGGFGMGHGRFDGVIQLLTFPGFWTFPIFFLLPQSLAGSKLVDFCAVIVLPTLVNIQIAVGLQRLVTRWNSRRNKQGGSGRV